MGIIGLLSFIARHPLNRGHSAAAIARFVRWQVASRLIPARTALPFVDESVLLAKSGTTGATGNWYNGLHEPEEMAFVLHSLRPDDLFGDIGANIGSFTVLAAKAVGASVIAAEPLPATFANLAANVRLNDIAGRVNAQCMGLSDHVGELRFTTSKDTMNRVALADDAEDTQIVPVTTLDALFEARPPSVLKIDVEGHEVAVLAGAERVLQSSGLRAVLVETNGSGRHYGHSDQAIFDRLTAAGFVPCSYDFESRTLRDAKTGSANTIFVRDPAAETVRCRSAPQFRLVNRLI